MLPKAELSIPSQDTLSDISQISSTNSDSSQSDNEFIEKLNQEAYAQVNPKLPRIPVFLYRKDTLSDLITKKLEEIVEKQYDYIESFKSRAATFFLENKNPSKQNIEEFIQQEKNISVNLPIKGVIGYFIGQASTKINLFGTKSISKEKVSCIIDELLEEDKQDKENGLDIRNTSTATISAYEEYFKEKYETLTENGMVYTLPQGKHKWSYNANWLLAHFHKGTDTFIIKSKIDDSSKLRGETSESKGDFGSGFFREIAICYSLGYKLEIGENHQIILKHHNPQSLKTLELDFMLPKPSNEEEFLKKIEPFYDEAIKYYSELTSKLELQHQTPSLGRLDSFDDTDKTIWPSLNPDQTIASPTIQHSTYVSSCYSPEVVEQPTKRHKMEKDKSKKDQSEKSSSGGSEHPHH